MHTHAGSAFDNLVTLTFDLLTSGSIHAERGACLSYPSFEPPLALVYVWSQLVAVLREVKYLLIRDMEEIPASASQLYANNDTLLMYVAHLDLTVAWYNKIRETVLEVEYPIIEAQLTDIDTQLQDAEDSLDWQTEGKSYTRLTSDLDRNFGWGGL